MDSVRSAITRLKTAPKGGIVFSAIAAAAVVVVVVLLALGFSRAMRKRRGKTQLLVRAATIRSSDPDGRVQSRTNANVASERANWGLSFWIRVSDFAATTSLKQVLHVGQTDPKVAIWLDKDFPRMWIALKHSSAHNSPADRLPADESLADKIVTESCLYKEVHERSASRCKDDRRCFVTLLDFVAPTEWTHITLAVAGPLVQVYKNGGPVRSIASPKSVMAFPSNDGVAVGSFPTPGAKTATVFDGDVRDLVLHTDTPDQAAIKAAMSTLPRLTMPKYPGCES